MPTRLEDARSLLATRLDELEREREQLLEAVAQLDRLINAKNSSNGVAKPKRSAAKRAAARGSAKPKRAGRRRKRAPRGEREKQLLSSIKTHPDYRVSEHAREVGVSPQQLYPLLGRLVEKDEIVKKDNKYTVK